MIMVMMVKMVMIMAVEDDDVVNDNINVYDSFRKKKKQMQIRQNGSR